MCRRLHEATNIERITVAARWFFKWTGWLQSALDIHTSVAGLGFDINLELSIFFREILDYFQYLYTLTFGYLHSSSCMIVLIIRLIYLTYFAPITLITRSLKCSQSLEIPLPIIDKGFTAALDLIRLNEWNISNQIFPTPNGEIPKGSCVSIPRPVGTAVPCCCVLLACFSLWLPNDSNMKHISRWVNLLAGIRVWHRPHMVTANCQYLSIWIVATFCDMFVQSRRSFALYLIPERNSYTNCLCQYLNFVWQPRWAAKSTNKSICTGALCNSKSLRHCPGSPGFIFMDIGSLWRYNQSKKYNRVPLVLDENQTEIHHS